MPGMTSLHPSCDPCARKAPGQVVLGPGWNGCGGAVLRGLRNIYAAHALREVRPALEEACRAAEDGLHVAGFVAYEAAPAFDRAMRCKPARTPLVWMAAFSDREAWTPDRVPPDPSALSAPGSARFACGPARYRALVETVREHIREGDVYQVNLTSPVSFAPRRAPWPLFEALLQRQPVPYAAWMDAGSVQLLSCSPELFFDRRGDCLTARPMKGTAPRGRTASEDNALAEWLARDEKNRAENIMIVDLLRNDLSRCCEPGSVRASAVCRTERYETLIQMTTSVQGRLTPGVSTPDVFAALFPCGSVTGAPKIRAMDLIRRCESEPRGAYCGAAGYMHGDRAVFNVAIRTVEVRSGEARLGVGSGVVWDSDPEKEYAECWLKAEFLTGPHRAEASPSGMPGPAPVSSPPVSPSPVSSPPVSSPPVSSPPVSPPPVSPSPVSPPPVSSPPVSSPPVSPSPALLRERGSEEGAPAPVLIETMRYDGGDVALLARHMSRLRASARALGHAWDEQAVRQRVADVACGPEPRRIRVALASSGALDVSTHPIPAAQASRVWRLGLAAVRIDSSDPLRRHKTTCRERYDRLHRKAVQEGFDEVIFLNERGEAAEGSRTNIVAQFGSRRITPPVESGALPGVYRRFLLDTQEDLAEGVLFPEDLRAADALYVCNAVAGCVPARLDEALGHICEEQVREEPPIDEKQMREEPPIGEEPPSGA